MAIACALHLGARLFQVDMKPLALLGPNKPAERNAAVEVGLAVDEVRPPGPVPGGGSLVPVVRGPLSAPAQPLKPLKPTGLVLRGPERKLEPVPREPLPAGAATFPADLLTSDDRLAIDTARPPAARRQFLQRETSPASASSPDAAAQVESASRSRGQGFGTNGGPGGLGRGRGTGVIGKGFAFGGPTGAFQANVCFIEPTVHHLTDITDCTPLATFFTNELNVPPRSFDSGFPGLGRRTEWFAIKYRGRFKVRHEDSYTFRLLSDDGAILEIDGRQILNNDGQHLPTSVSSNTRLAAGEHEFSLFYYQGPAAFLALQLFVRRFQEEERLFSPVL